MSDGGARAKALNQVASLGIGLKHDPWLSAVTGWDCLTDSDKPEAALGVHGSRVRLLITIRLPIGDAYRLRMLTMSGFDVIDVGVCLRRRPMTIHSARSATPPAKRIEVEVARPQDIDRIGEIASEALTQSRFHSDPNIDNSIARRVKRKWARNLASGARGISCLTASVDGNIVGFLGIVANDYSRHELVVDLLAVDTRWQGNGVGRALLGAFAKYCDERSVASVAGTQLQNVSALRAYQSAGFQFENSHFLLHAHLGGIADE